MKEGAWIQSAENKKWKEEEKHIDVTTTKWASAIAAKHGQSMFRLGMHRYSGLHLLQPSRNVNQWLRSRVQF
jgi:hypothetical protein